MGQALAAGPTHYGWGPSCAFIFISYFFTCPEMLNQPCLLTIENSCENGRSFSTRRVKAVQMAKYLFIWRRSFNLPGWVLEHQYAECQCTAPEDIEPDIKFLWKITEWYWPCVRAWTWVIHKTDWYTYGAKPLIPYNPKLARAKWRLYLDESARRLGWVIFKYLIRRCWPMRLGLSFFRALVCNLHMAFSARNKTLRMANYRSCNVVHHPFGILMMVIYCAESPFTVGQEVWLGANFLIREGKLVAFNHARRFNAQIEESILIYSIGEHKVKLNSNRFIAPG